MNRIIPTILATSEEELNLLLRKAETFCGYVQVDIMDGRFAPNVSITNLELIKAEPKLEFEVDLMVSNPHDQINGFAAAGASELDFYVESSADIDTLINDAKIKGLKVGLTTLPKTPLSTLEKYADKVDSIRFFSGHLGFYGGEFDGSVLPKVKEARAKWPNKILAIDGGVSLDNIGEIKNAGINWFAVGSRIMGKENPAEEYKKFQEAIA